MSMTRTAPAILLLLLTPACTDSPIAPTAQENDIAVGAPALAEAPNASVAQASPNGYRIVWDTFTNGFSVDAPNAKWFYFSAGPYVGNDGLETTHPSGLKVVSSGTNATTGDPAFTLTLAQEGSDDNPYSLPGGLDHVKWLVYMNTLASSGMPGFDAVAGQELTCESTMSGESFGNAAHTFGSAVENAEDDLRLGAVAMNSIDFDSFMVFDFFLTNERIYAFYERLPFADRAVYGNYAAFSFQIPVADRNPEDDHNLKIAYDKAAGTVRWLVEGVEVFRVDRIGYRIDREYMVLDHGGVEQDVSPNQLNCGMGMFTLLDAHGPQNTGLVKLSNAPGFYFNPEVGAPEPESFIDEAGLASNRLFGQGAELRMRQYVVSSRPSVTNF